MARKRTSEQLEYHRKYMSQYRIDHPEFAVFEDKKRYQRSKTDGSRQRINLWHSMKRQQVFDMYGNKCACCGETQREFLSLDHIHGGGKEHRKRIGTGGSFWNSILKDENAMQKYRLLCFNCNMSRGFFGFCPHEKESPFLVEVAC